MTDKALISEYTWRNLEMQRKAFPDLPHFLVPDEVDILLRPTTRKYAGTIHVISLAVIANKEDEFREFIKRAWQRDYRIRCYETGHEIWPGRKLEDAVTRWKAARRDGAAKIGARASADKKKAITMVAVEKIKDRWPMPSKDHPPADLLAEVGISLNTVKAHLGSRIVAQANYRAKLKRKAAKDAKR